MKEIIQFKENGIHCHIEVTDDGEVRLLHLGPMPGGEVDERHARWHRLVEVQEIGMNQNDHHGSKHTGTQPGALLRYWMHRDVRNENGRLLELTQEYDGLMVTSHLQFYDGIPVVRSWTTLENHSDHDRPIEYVSSFACTGINAGSSLPRDEDARVHLPHSTWYGEAQWKAYTLKELGYDAVNLFSMKRIALSSTGSWAASEYLPMGAYENVSSGVTMTWQIETSVSWNWEISDIEEEMYLQLSGPSYQENHFVRNLRPDEQFVSVPCAIAMVCGSFQDTVQALTKYRRRIRRENADNTHPSVIFNDYMNCLNGDPTTEKLLPLIDAAAEMGCKYFCIDAGWYDDGPWWDGVGEWLPSKARFPGGITEPLRRIRERGMIPGLWLEPEVMGIHCPMVEKVSPEWFFQRNGRPIIDHGRYQLDFRNPEVTAHLDRVIDRLVKEYGVGYIKVDYNINAGPGTELHADSAGDGLLRHTRAYLEWLDRVFARYPDLIIENCSSGGMRMEYSMLSRCSIQSVTDQTDYLKMAAIACNCMTALTPEQAAIWSYPLRDGDCEETAFNMVSAILLRIHQSGHLAELSAERKALVREGIAYHQSICDMTKDCLPYWPIGLGSMSDDFLCVGLDGGCRHFLAVWCIHSGTCDIPLEKNCVLQQTYPLAAQTNYQWDEETGILHVQMQSGTARIFELKK